MPAFIEHRKCQNTIKMLIFRNRTFNVIICCIFSAFHRMEKYLEEIFKHLNSTYKSLESRLKAEGFKARVVQVLKAWEEWLVYDREFITKLKTIYLGIQHVCEIVFGWIKFIPILMR